MLFIIVFFKCCIIVYLETKLLILTKMKKLKKLELSQLSNDELNKLQGGREQTQMDIKTYDNETVYIDRSYVWDYCGGGNGYWT